ncbi:MAG: hypothetical protein WCD70_01100 [Alphaproteobacteria bacterium]
MPQTAHNATHAIETIIYGMPHSGEAVIVSRKRPVKIPSLQQLKEILAMPEPLTEGEQQACNMATD